MKIGIVCYPTFGGSGVVATELGIALAKEGHKVHFISYSQPVRLDFFSENIFYHEVIVSSYPLFDYQPYEILLASKLVDVVKHEKLDLLHVHYAIPHASAAYLAKQILKSHGISIPFITTLHGTDITLVGKDASFEPVISFSINESDAVTAVSQSLKDDTYKFFDIKKEIHVIPNFISISDFEQLKNKEEYNGICQKKMYSPSGEKILMHISNFRKVKRLDDVIGIFENVRKQIPSKLLLIGDGPERNRIEQLCREKNIYRDVKFLGKITTPEMLLRVADLFLLPSETESFGLAALEAMAMNVPVISTNTGGLPEVNINAVSGFTSNVGDVEDMSQNALKILSDPLILQKFRRQAFEVAQQFDLPKILPLYEDLYKEVIEKNKEKV
ncbi:MAG: N-acetyl-alpha-D-glucosaminyl L-malate synthase BshA [Bacteroidota bacterium]|jgi:N-acetyl-alpha-D-glucosaminyl L-malate synthase BshA